MTPRFLLSALATAALLHATGAQAGWVTVSNAGSPVLTTCNLKDANGNQSPTLTTCKINALPTYAADGFILANAVPQRTTNISVTGDTGTAMVGKLYEKVWCHSTNGTTCDSTNQFIFGMRANLNADTSWNSDGETFEINDLFHAVPSGATVDIAYFMGTVAGGTNVDTAQANKYLEYAGRTKKGLGEYAASPNGLNPTRNNAWIDFRADANALDPDGISSAWSPWVFARLTCPTGIDTTARTSKLRLHQGGEEGQSDIEVLLTGYVCK